MFYDCTSSLSTAINIVLVLSFFLFMHAFAIPRKSAFKVHITIIMIICICCTFYEECFVRKCLLLDTLDLMESYLCLI